VGAISIIAIEFGGGAAKKKSVWLRLVSSKNVGFIA
jgi:hypothetical protein